MVLVFMCYTVLLREQLHMKQREQNRKHEENWRGRSYRVRRCVHFTVSCSLLASLAFIKFTLVGGCQEAWRRSSVI